MSFEGFSKEGLAFLARLGTQDKAWFDRQRKTYGREIVAPTKAFVAELGEVLAGSVSPSIVAQPKTNGSIAPINNDIRFAKDKPPYKDHLLLKFWDGPDKKLAPTLHVFVSEKTVGFATGAAFKSVDRWRELVDDEDSGAALADALRDLADGRELYFAGQTLKRVPGPYPPDHPRAELLRYKSFQARWPEPAPPEIHSAEFVDWCAERLAACAPVHHWFVEHQP